MTGSIKLFLKSVAAATLVVACVSVVAPRDANACPVQPYACNTPEQTVMNICGGQTTGAMWFNRAGSSYFTDTVNVSSNETSIPVALRGSAYPCGDWSTGWNGVWAVNIAPTDTCIDGPCGGNAWRLTGLSSTTLFRGYYQNHGWLWSSQGGTVGATLNLSGIPANNSTSPVTYDMVIGIYRCYSSNGTSCTGNDYGTRVPIKIVRAGRPITWAITPTVAITSPAATNRPGQTLTWSHTIRNNGPDTTHRSVTYRAQNQGSLGTGNAGSWTESGLTNNATRTQNSTYTITQADVGNQVCRRTTVSPRSSSDNSELASATACRTIPYSYNLTPAITMPSGDTIVESDNVPVSVGASIGNSGNTKSHTNIDWRVTQVEYGKSASIPNRAGGVSASDPCAYFGGTCTTLNSNTEAAGFAWNETKTYTANGQRQEKEAGTKICFAMSVRRNSSSSTDWRHSRLQCLIIGKSPKVQVWGGGVMVGRTFRSGAPSPLRATSSVMTSVTSKEATSVLGQAPAGSITGLWKTGVNDAGAKLPENQSDPHWSIDRVYRPSSGGVPGVTATCQKGWKGGSFAAIPTTPGANFDARTIVEDPSSGKAGQSIHGKGSNSIVGDAWYGSNLKNGAYVWNRMSPNARWIGQNHFGQNYSANGCQDPTNPISSGTAESTTPRYDNANIYVFKLRTGIRVGNNDVDLSTIRLNLRGAADNQVKYYVNGCELRGTGTRYINDSGVATDWQRPDWRDPDPQFASSGVDAYVVGGAPGCATGSTGFKYGDNSFEAHIRSTYSHTGMLIDLFEATAQLRQQSKKVYGSWAEYGIAAPSQIKDMASGSGLNGGHDSADQGSWSALSFTGASRAAPCSFDFGCYTPANTTLPDVRAAFPTSPSTPLVGTSVTPSSLAGPGGGRIVQPQFPAQVLRIRAGSLTRGQWAVINAPNTNVVIEGDITYENGPFSNPSDIPQLIIIAHNITIASNVTRVDAWLIADNAVSTCDQQGDAGWLSTGTNYTSAPARLTASLCDRQLQVNGPVMAQELYLRRTAGSGPGDQAGDPAEVFNLRPDAYMWAQARATGTQVYRTTGLKEAPPRY